MEVWFQDEARIGQNKLTSRWVRRGTRPRAPKRPAHGVNLSLRCHLPQRGQERRPCSAVPVTAAPWLCIWPRSRRPWRKMPTPRCSWIRLAGIVRPLEVPTTSPSSSSRPARPSSTRSITSASSRATTGCRTGFHVLRDIVDHFCEAWSKLVDRPWTIMSIGMRHWAHGLQSWGLGISPIPSL
jgi:putative transposase